MSWPWLDRAGRFSAFKATGLALAVLPGAELALRWAVWGLGARPVTEAIHVTGLWAIRLLLLTLAISPLKTVLHWPRLPQLRRMAGLAALSYGVAHLVLYAVDQNGRLLHVAAEIVSRVYLTIGFTALLGMAVLGVTSTDAWMRSLGRRWKRLHRLTYAAAGLAALHFFMQSKADVTEAAVMAGFLAWLLLWRLLPGRWHGRARVLLALAPVAGAVTALAESGWYAAATKVNAHRVWAANFDFDFAPRPAAWVTGVALAVALAALARTRPPWVFRTGGRGRLPRRTVAEEVSGRAR